MATYRVTLLTPDGEFRFDCDERAYLLETAAEHEIALPFTCQQGWCITCAGRLLEGSVDHSEALRYYPEDERAGFVLLCCAYPRSDVRIVTHQKAAMQRHRHAHGLPAPLG